MIEEALSAPLTAHLLNFTFLFLAVAAHVGVVTVERPCGGMRAAAVILSIQCVDGDVYQMEDDFAAVHVSVRVLWMHTHRITYITNFFCISMTLPNLD